MNDTKNRASFLASLTRATKKSKAGGVAAKKNCKAHHLRQKKSKARFILILSQHQD
jgi:hypothetical protein